jgi:hypothetical protein
MPIYQTVANVQGIMILTEEWNFSAPEVDAGSVYFLPGPVSLLFRAARQR